MSNWINKLSLKDLWKARDENNLTIQQLAQQVAKRIEKMPCYKKYEKYLRVIVSEFRCCEEDIEEFDNILKDLYDWADTPLRTPRGEMQRKLCWIATC